MKHFGTYSLLALRAAALLLVVLMLALAELSMAATVSIVVAITVSTALLLWRSRAKQLSNSELSLHLVIDIGLLFSVLYLSSGAASAFVSFFLLPIAVAAVMLKPLQAAGITALAMAAYSSLLLLYLQASESGSGMAHHAQHFSAHVLGMWANFMLSATLLAATVAWLASNIRQRDALVAEAQASALEREQISALHLQAAGMAHELATPLSSALMLVDELRLAQTQAAAEYQQGSAAVNQHSSNVDDLNMLTEQLLLCKQAVQGLSSGKNSPGPTSLSSLVEFAELLRSRWQLLRPEAKLKIDNLTQAGDARIAVDNGLIQAMISLLNNAADANANAGRAVDSLGMELRLITMRSQTVASLVIYDQGPGYPADLLEAGIVAWNSDKVGGLGLGLWVAERQIQRLDGRLLLRNHAGGACCEVQLPLAEPLQTPATT